MKRDVSGAASSRVIDVSGGDQTIPEPRAIYVGGTGDIICRLAGDNEDRTFVGVAAGLPFMVCPTVIRQTGTTATNLVALY